MTGDLERSYAEANRELAEAFERYLISRGFSAPTLRAYMDSVNRYVEALHSTSVVDATRREIREFQAGLLKRGLSSNSLRLHTIALRGFHKFISLSGLTKHDPTLLLSPRKLPGRIPRFLTVEEVDKLLAACETPVETAVVEVMYSTGVRLSELVSLRVEDITFSEPGVIRVNRGKGDKDRIVLFGRKAKAAIERYLNRRTTGFLFEVPARTGQFFKHSRSWYARFYDAGEQREVRLGKLRDPRRLARWKLLKKIQSLRASGVGWQEIRRRTKISRKCAQSICKHPNSYRCVPEYRFLSEPEARSEAEHLKADTQGFTAHPAGPYNKRSIRLLLSRLAFRAGIAGLHPHALRRSFATHLLQGGADIRSVQELLGHVSLSTTQIYTRLSIDDLKAIHTRSHPHAKEDEHGGKEN